MLSARLEYNVDQEGRDDFVAATSQDEGDVATKLPVVDQRNGVTKPVDGGGDVHVLVDDKDDDAAPVDDGGGTATIKAEGWKDNTDPGDDGE